MTRLQQLLHDLPLLSLFLSLLLGTALGRVHVRGVGFGSVVGTLIAAMAVGVFAEPVLPDLLRWAFFYLFLFAVGYSVGPQFFGSLRKDAGPQVILAVVVAVTGLLTVVAMTAIFGFDEGVAVGLLSGGLTQSAALGTGLSAIAELPLPDATKATLMANAPLADAITYGFGDLGLILFLTWLGPRLLRADLRREAEALEQELAADVPEQSFSAVHYSLRAFRLDNPSADGVTLDAFERRHAAARLCVHRVARDGRTLTLAPLLTLRAGDRLVVSAQRRAFRDAEREIGAELDDASLLAVPLTTANVVVTSGAAHGATLGDLAQDAVTRGVYLESVRRGATTIPREAWTVLARGDVLRVVGAPEAVARVGRHVGVIENDVAKTDLMFLAGGICVGMLAGLLSMRLGDMTLGLGTAGSILMAGLAAGWARSRYPVFGAIPEASQRLLMDIGLTVFIAGVGLQAGPHALEAYHTSGGLYFARIFLAGAVVTMVPLAAGAVAGQFLLKMRPLMTLGGLAGAQTCTPGLNALRDACGSNIGSLAYTVPYAIGNILLTVCGALVVALVFAMRQAGWVTGP